jgi:hypothetical protein
MMAFEPKPNTGSLWPNEYKKQDNHPDVRGDVNIEKTLLENLILKSKGDLVKIAIAGWSKEIKGKKVLSITASEPYEKPSVSDDLPY